MKTRFIFILLLIFIVSLQAEFVIAESDYGIVVSKMPVINITCPEEGDVYITDEIVIISFSIEEDSFFEAAAEPVGLKFFFNGLHYQEYDVNIATEDSIFSYEWTVPDISSDIAYVSVTAVDNFGNIVIEKSGNFAITTEYYPPPQWEPISGNLNNMQADVNVTLFDEQFTNSNPANILAAFGPGGENDCRAIALWDQVGPYAMWYMCIRSNASYEEFEPITFKIYDADSGTIYNCEGEYDIYFAPKLSDTFFT